MGFPVLSITAPGQVQLASYAKPTLNIMGAQSIAFDPAGAKAYVSCVREMPDPAPAPADPAFPRNVIVVLDIASPGVASHAGTILETDFIGTSQLFGVDTLAMEPSGRYLYVSNMTLSGGRQHLQVLDVHTGLTVKMLPFGEVLFPEITNPDGTVTPASMEQATPTGLFFRKP
jgi:DNA-binding beta-propeller fold protein YncE